MENPNLRDRLEMLPKSSLDEIIPDIKKRSGCSNSTYNNVLKGESLNIKVLVAIKEVFNCTLDDVLNPKFQFQDPLQQKALQKVDAYFERIGAKQVR
jgi:transcriptional regulator with XRE-family HTH domain